MRIAVIGAGNVGRTLGTGWQKKGHSVRYGVRNPEPGNAEQATVAEAATSAEVVVLSTPWEAVKDAVVACGDLTGKVLVDCTNPLLPGLAGIAIGTDTSGAEFVASLAPGARVVKAFNTIGFNIMANPHFGERSATLFYCGDDAAAKQAVHTLASDLGFSATDAGPLQQARLLEPFALLWITLALKHGHGREIAFDLMHR